MKKKEPKNVGKVYPFRFNALGITLCIFALLLCAIGAGISVYRIITVGVNDFSQALQSPFLIAVSLFCAAVFIAVLVKSEYVVTSESLTTRFGFITSKLSLASITSMEHDRTTHKLMVYCGEEFTAFTLKKEWADELVSEILKANPQIEFSFTMTENKPPKENGKKKKNPKDDQKDE
jgi:hypothetical protein